MDPLYNQALEMEARRQTLDSYLTAQGQANGVNFKLCALMALPTQMHPYVPRTPFTRVAYSGSFTRGRYFRLLQYRFDPDPLYIIAPATRSGVLVSTVVKLFAGHYFCPIKATAEGIPTHYAPPVRIGDIPKLFNRPVESCFAWGEGMRLDCVAIPREALMWISAEGQVIDGIHYPPMVVGWDQMLAVGE